MKENSACRIACQHIRCGAAKRKGRLSVLLALTLAMGSAVLNSGCAPQQGLTCPPPIAGSSEYILKQVVFNGVTFKNQIAEQNGLLPAEAFWFSASDNKTIQYGWSEAFWQAHAPKAPECNYQTPSEGCQQCDICASDNALGVICNDGSSLGLVLQDVTFGELSEINEQGDPVPIQPITLPGIGCFNRRGNPPLPSFAPEKDTDYILRLKDFCGNTVSNHEFKTKVVNTSRPIAEPPENYRLVPYTNDEDPALRFTFQMPTTADGKLRENFSPNLKVTKVRVLLGKTDSMTGGAMVLKDVATLRKWHPSRILFLPDFRVPEPPAMGNINASLSERINRCYLDASKPDGDFNLLNCRSGEVTPRRWDTPANITPTYMHGRNIETLTWVIEYKLESGLTEVPALGTGEFLVLEFTIE